MPVHHHYRPRKPVLAALEHTYATIAPSPAHGVGVVAVRAIPAGVDPFPSPPDVLVRLSPGEVAGLPPAVRRLLRVRRAEDGSVLVPAAGLDKASLRRYVNSGPEPNLVPTGHGSYRTSRPVRAGEELLVAS